MSWEDIYWLQNQLQQHLRETKPKHITVNSKLGEEDDVEFLLSLKEVFEKNGALEGTVISEDGLAAGEAYKNILAALERARGKSPGESQLI